MTKQQFTIVSIEDSTPDFELLKQALMAVGNISYNLINIQNGQEAMEFLYKKGKYEHVPTPDLIILDINLPKISGLNILRCIKSDNELRLIPVIVFSTSDSEKDIEESYALSANTYITKTFDLKELFDKIKIVANYWFKTAKLPTKTNFNFIHKQRSHDNLKDKI